MAALLAVGAVRLARSERDADQRTYEKGSLSEAQDQERAARAGLYPERRRRATNERLRLRTAAQTDPVTTCGPLTPNASRSSPGLCEHAVAGRLNVSELEGAPSVGER